MNLYSLMRFGFVAAGCFLLQIDVDAVVARCIWEDNFIAYMCAHFMELLTKLILMLQRATLHNIKSYLICPLRGKGSRLLFERARFAGTGQT